LKIHHCPPAGGWEGFTDALSQKTCQANSTIFQLSGERLEDIRMKGILIFSISTRKQSHKNSL
jgi:hypothetical protein